MWGINATAAGVGRITRSKTSRSILVRGASWDGPPRKHLLNMMPDVYGDEPEGKPADAFTRYAAVTSPGTMFSADGVAFDPAAKPRRFGHGVLMKDLQDAAFCTLMVGTLDRNARIPWTKPDDVVISDEPARFRAEGFFGAPYESVRGLDKTTGPYGLFARADGGLAVISDDDRSGYLPGTHDHRMKRRSRR